VSDLIERLRAMACQHGGKELYKSRAEWHAADALEAKDAEIASLKNTISLQDNLLNMYSEDNEKLRAALALIPQFVTIEAARDFVKDQLVAGGDKK